MQEKVQTRKRAKAVREPEVVESVEVEVEVRPIFYGIATTDLILEGGSVWTGEQVDILEDKGDEWLTDKGLVSKLFLLLKKIN
ncbi:hypothetical protein AAXB25_14530 [Paenibacillus lautus]|uniref:hypothetical protein n=1 Tax=Paenibacillus lautus TaxID=1401 RepID=UPI003D280E0F